MNNLAEGMAYGMPPISEMWPNESHTPIDTMSHCSSRGSWECGQQFPSLGSRQKLEGPWERMLPMESFNLSDLPFSCLSSGHTVSALFPVQRDCENPMKSYPWKCLVSWTASSNHIECDAFICNLGNKTKWQDKSEMELAVWDHLLCMFPILKKTSNPHNVTIGGYWRSYVTNEETKEWCLQKTAHLGLPKTKDFLKHRTLST